MKRIFQFTFVFFSFLFLFLFISPIKNSSFAATCAQTLPSGFCVSKSLSAECFRTSTLASNCTSTQICCQSDPTPTPTPVYTCTTPKVTGQYCSPEPCDSATEIAVSKTCPTGRRCCKAKPPTPTPTTPVYTCLTPPVTGQYCSPEPCDTATETAVSKTCRTGYKCCKRKTGITANCSALGGYCSPSACTPEHPKIVGGTCGSTPTTTYCCNSQFIGDPGTTTTQCPVCEGVDYYYDNATKNCVFQRDSFSTSKPPTIIQCTERQLCYPGCGCDNKTCGSTTFSCPDGANCLPCPDGKNCETALGTITTNATGLVTKVFGVVLSLSSGLAVLLIILSGYRIIAAQGNPEKLQGAREQLVAAIIGLIFVSLAFSLLRFIGVDLLGLFPK